MSPDQDQPAGPIIAAFGGIRPMANKLDVPVSTVQGWKQRDTIPAARMDDIRKVAGENGITLPDTAAAPIIIDAEATEEAPENAPEDASGDADDEAPDEKASSLPRMERTGSAAPARGGNGPALAISVLALLISAGAAGWVWWTTAGPEAAPYASNRVSVLEGRIASLTRGPDDPGKDEREALAGDIESLRTQVAELTPLRDELSRLSQRAGELHPSAGGQADPEVAARLASLENEIRLAQERATNDFGSVSGGLQQVETRIAALNEQMDTLARQEVRQDAVAADAIALTVASGQLRRAIERGQPYPEVLATLREVSGDESTLDELAAGLAIHADTGVATRRELLFAFPGMAQEILDNAPTGAKNNIVDQILDRAQRIVRVRRVGADMPEDTLDGRLARAEVSLKDGDVAGAIAALDGMDGASAEAAAPWLAKARAHMAVRDAADKVEDLALVHLRAAGRN